MLVALIVRPHRAMLCYVLVTLGFTLLWSDAPAETYFLLAVLADMFCVMLLSVFNTTRKILYMMTVCVASIIMNLFGFMMWYTYQSSDWYVWGFTVIYAAAICIILRGDDSHVGGRNAGLYFHRYGDRSDAGLHRGNFTEGNTTI